MAQATIRYLCAQYVELDGARVPLFAGVWAIFGHGNVAGLGEALYAERKRLPTYRAHNEQAMAHAAIAFAKASQRRRMMACTASAGPGSTNMVTAAALAHINRLPVLFLPGDTFATRLPDPVLQQLEAYHDYTLTTNDCFRPVSRFFDRNHTTRAADRIAPAGAARADRSRRVWPGDACDAAGRSNHGLGLPGKPVRAAHASPAATAPRRGGAAGRRRADTLVTKTADRRRRGRALCRRA